MSDAQVGGVGLDASTLDGGLRRDAATPRGDASSARSDAQVASEVCDGIDNDGDGAIDNLDVGNDGVCDCLTLATLGLRGTFGQGDVFSAWLGARSDAGAASLDGQVLTPELLAKYQVIIAEDLSKMMRAYTTAEIDALEAWVKAGGGLMTLIGYADSSERTQVNAVIARFGLSYGPEQILQKTNGQTVPVTMWFGPHPVIDGPPVSPDGGPNESVSRLGIDNGYPVLGDGQTLASEGGHDVLKAKQVGSGHVIVWGDEWITYDSEWKDHPEYQVERFWIYSLRWLTTARSCQVPTPVYI